MSDLKHTPGPWTGFNGFDIFSGRKIVAAFWTRPSPQDEALILAAPELLAALKAFVEAEESFRRHSSTPYPAGELDSMAVAYNGAKTAIMKAEGGAA